ncbi:zeta toxin family protein [Brevibacterium otitidis]|uniref:UDP-N-acetylglucosamine kinase n=1 Tax=Brevibacterium otitidis TaxID=53364 RepID=A0ABV5WXE1_9MICO|nr:hypothetical protein GCM10023233_32290 [Brevibacterium otitidis]
MAAPEFDSPQWLAWQFEHIAREDIFGDYAPTPESPRLVLLGGQPAAGKTVAQDAILAEDPTLVPITGDDLREYHPDYARLMVEEPLAMPEKTAPVSGGLVRLALEHALAHRFSVLLEGTFRDPEMVTGTASRFAEAGYRVEVVAVATPAAVSRLSAQQRALAAAYPGIGRWTPPEAHETAVAGSPRVVAALEALPFITRVRVFSRERLLHDTTGESAAGSVSAADVLQGEQTRRPAPGEALAWLARYEQVFALARARPGYLGPASAPAFRLLQADAQTMIDIATTMPGVDTAELDQQQRWRRLYVEQVAPESTRTKARRALRRLTGGRNPGREDPWQPPGRSGPDRRDPPGRSL